MTQSAHVDYPHEPGRLYDCPACESRCHCTPGTAECIFEGEHQRFLTDFTVGQRVELHPATDAWMQGDRFGEVRKIGRKYVTVFLERSGRQLMYHPRHVMPIKEASRG